MFQDMSRFDDLWSVFYITVENMVGQLPWRLENERAKVQEMKENCNLFRQKFGEVTSYFPKVFTSICCQSHATAAIPMPNYKKAPCWNCAFPLCSALRALTVRVYISHLRAGDSSKLLVLESFSHIKGALGNHPSSHFPVFQAWIPLLHQQFILLGPLENNSTLNCIDF